MTVLKRAALTLLSVILLLSFTGCGASEPEPTVPKSTVYISGTAPVLPGTPEPPEETVTLPTATEPAPTASPLQAIPKKPWTVDDWVTEEYHEVFTWESEMGHAYSIPISFPRILPVGSFATEFNERITESIGWRVAELQECIETKTDTHLLSISYEAYLNGDTLSIVLVEETSIDLVGYTVYNFDLEDREAMTTADMCDEYMDLDYPQFLILTNRMIRQEFEENFSQIKESEPDTYNEILGMIDQDTISMYGRGLYLKENGQLMLVYDKPSVAGAQYYPTFMEFRPDRSLIPSEAEAYNWFFDLAAKTDGAYATAFESLVRLAFDEDEDDFSEALAKRGAEDLDRIVDHLVAAYLDQPDLLRREAMDVETEAVRNAILNALG